ncbi:MAG: hypothetical protein ACTSR8_22045 [Promethearchaeota archaeon]
MKLRLNLKIAGNEGKEKTIKFNIAPTKQKGLINFINQVLKQGNEINFSFEKISKSGVESSKIEGIFKLKAFDDKKLKALTEEIEAKERHRKKQQQKRKHKTK